MADAQDAWSEVGSAMEALALKLKLHAEESSGFTTDQMKGAIEQFGEGVRQAASAVGEAFGDPAVKDDARRVGAAVGDAIAATFAQISGDRRSQSD